MTDIPAHIRIGTRGSKLAVAQAETIRTALIETYSDVYTPDSVTLEIITTTGDKIQDRPLSEVGGKGLFTKEIEDALLSGHIDMAVHSMKDMPTVLPDGLMIACLPPREDPHDAFLSTRYARLAELPEGARIGTSALRRSSLLKALRPDIIIVPLRGNVTTRLAKLEDGELDGIILAVAGLRRLGLQHHITEKLSSAVMLPAVAQGAVGIEIMQDNIAMQALLQPLHDPFTGICVDAERAMLKVLDGSCRTPIAGYARVDQQGMLQLHGLQAEEDGSAIYRAQATGVGMQAEKIGQEVGERILSQLPR